MSKRAELEAKIAELDERIAVVLKEASEFEGAAKLQSQVFDNRVTAKRFSDQAQLRVDRNKVLVAEREAVKRQLDDFQEEG